MNTGLPTLLNQPYSEVIYQGGNAALTPAVLGAAPLSFQWLQNGVNLAGATNNSVAFINAQVSDAGSYQLVVSNSFGAVTSAVAVLTVSPTGPFFVAQPTNQWVLQNSNVTLTGSVTGLPPLTYQWLFNGASIPGATNISLAITNAQPHLGLARGRHGGRLGQQHLRSNQRSGEFVECDCHRRRGRP